MDINITPYNENDHLVLRLKYFLNFELSGTLLYAMSFVNEIALFVTILLAAIFTPFMLYVLMKSKRYGWITAFAIIIVIPSVLMVVIVSKSLYVLTFLLIELGIFYLYCFILRFAVNDWCEEINWRMLRHEQEKEKKERDKMMQNYFT